MSRIFENLEIPIDQELEEKIAYLMPSYGEYRILRQSVDARQRHSPKFVYSVEVSEFGEKLQLSVNALIPDPNPNYKDEKKA